MSEDEWLNKICDERKDMPEVEAPHISEDIQRIVDRQSCALYSQIIR